MSKNALGICYESSTIFRIGEFVAKFWTVQIFWSQFPIGLRIARTDYWLYDSVIIKIFANWVRLSPWIQIFVNLWRTGPRSAVGNVPGNRCESDCRSRGREFDPGPVSYFRGDWSWNNFYGHSPPSAESSRRVVVSYKWKYVHEVLVNCLFKLAQEKVWLGELTVPQWP